MLQRIFRQILMLVSIVLLGATGARGQTIPVSIPDTTAQKGDTLLIPIRITSLAVSDSVYSGHMSFTYDVGVIDIFGIETAGTMAASPVSAFYNTATRELAFASANIITGSGVFVYLKTRVRETPTRDTTTIWFPDTSFNEGNRKISLNDGKFRILKMTVAPKSPPTLLVVGDSLQFSVSGDHIPPLTWTSSDTAVGSVDTTGEFKALAVGQAKVYVEDSRGLKDSTTLFPVYPASAASLTISAHDTSHTQTLEFDLPVYITNVTGLGIIASEFTMNFSSTRLQAISVIQAGTMTDSWSAPAYNIVSGQIDVVLAGTEELVGSGILVYVRMRVLPAASGGSTVSFANVLFNENLTANTVSATFTPILAPIVVVTPASVQIVRDDTLSFFVTSGGTPPYVWSSSNPTVASINPSTGLLTANVRGTTTVSVTDSYGFVGTTGTITVTDVQVSVADTAVWPLDSVDVPIFVDDMTGLEIYSYEMRIVYDSSVAKILSVVTDGTLSSSFTVFAKDTLDTLRIAVAGMSPLSGSGILLKVRFKSNSLPPSVSPLTIAKCQFDEPGIGTPTAKTQNGSLSVVDAAVIPLLNSPPDAATNVEVDATLLWNSSLGASFYDVQLSLDPAFGSVVESATGVSGTSFVPSGLLMLDTVYYWRVRAGNAGGTTAFSAEWSFRTVVGNVNQLPFVTLSLPDTTIAEAQALAITVTAIDPDSDALTFGILSGPSGAQITESGEFSWTPTYSDSGFHTIIVSISDGFGAVNDTATIYVSNVNRFPFFLAVLPDTSIFENSTLSYNLSGSDADSDVLTFSKVSGPAGLTVSAGGQVQWPTTYSDSGSYSVVISLFDGLDAVKDTAVISALNVNRLPILTAGLPDSAVAENDTLTFTVIANDPDGTALTFSLVDGPSGASMTPDGSFSWVPSFLQAGIDTIVLRVNDDLGSVLDTAVITVLNVNRLPGTILLLSPAQDDTIQLAIPLVVDFRWSKSVDPDTDDTLRYLLRIQGPALDTTIVVVTDTSILVDLVGRLVASSDYSWSVSVTDLIDTVQVQQSFSFRTSATITAVGNPGAVPTEFTLSQNYPNPFNPSTTIAYDVPSQSIVTVQIFNMIGQLVSTLVDNEHPAGRYSVTWRGTSEIGVPVSSGIYFYRIHARSNGIVREFTQTRKLMLIK